MIVQAAMFLFALGVGDAVQAGWKKRRSFSSSKPRISRSVKPRPPISKPTPRPNVVKERVVERTTIIRSTGGSGNNNSMLPSFIGGAAGSMGGVLLLDALSGDEQQPVEEVSAQQDYNNKKFSDIPGEGEER